MTLYSLQIDPRQHPNGHSQVLKLFMLKYGELDIKLNDKNKQWRTSFHWACIHGFLKLAEMLLKNSAVLEIELDAKDIYGRTAFHYACRNGYLEIAKILMKRSKWGSSKVPFKYYVKK